MFCDIVHTAARESLRDSQCKTKLKVILKESSIENKKVCL